MNMVTEKFTRIPKTDSKNFPEKLEGLGDRNAVNQTHIDKKEEISLGAGNG